MEDLVQGVIARLHYAGLFIVLVLGGVGLPLPEDLVLLSCGFMISGGVMDAAPALITAYSGMLLADFMLFSIGRKYGRSVLESPRFGRLLSAERLSMLVENFRRRGVLVIITGRHIAGVRPQIFLAAGILGMPAGRFIAADAFSALITLCIMVGIGYRGGESMQVLRQDITRVGHIAIAVAVAAVAAYLLYVYIRRWKGEK